MVIMVMVIGDGKDCCSTVVKEVIMMMSMITMATFLIMNDDNEDH